MEEQIHAEPAAPGSGLAGFLEPHEISGGCGVDLALVRRAVKERWPMKPEVRSQIMARLGEIVARASVAIPGTQEGGFESVAMADKTAVAAANVLRMMQESDRDAAFRAAEFIQRERKPGGININAENVQVIQVQGECWKGA